MTPRVSVSVALVTRNRPRSLERCLESWRRQTVAPDEIMVSDDSDDETAGETARGRASFRMPIHRGARAAGSTRTATTRASQCRGTHIVSADDDHTHPTDYLAVITDLV